MRVNLAIQLILQLSHFSQLKVVCPPVFFYQFIKQHVILWTVSIVSEVLKTLVKSGVIDVMSKQVVKLLNFSQKNSKVKMFCVSSLYELLLKGILKIFPSLFFRS